MQNLQSQTTLNLAESRDRLEAALAGANALFTSRRHPDDVHLGPVRDLIESARDAIAWHYTDERKLRSVLLTAAQEWLDLSENTERVDAHERRKRDEVLALVLQARGLLG